VRTLLVLVRKDFAQFLSNKTAVVLSFIVPIALIFIFGQVFGLNQATRGPTGIPLAVVNASDHPSAARLVEALKAEKTFRVITDVTAPDQPSRLLAEKDLRPLMRDNHFRFAVVIPADLISGESLGLRLKIYTNPRNEIETQTVTGVLQRAIFTNVPTLLGESLQARARSAIGADKLTEFNRSIATNVARSFGGDPAEIERRIASGQFVAAPVAADTASAGGSSASDDVFKNLVRIETEQVAGKEVKSPEATRIVGGFSIQFLLFALNTSAAALFYERDRGIFHRILAGPVTRAHILWSKFIYGSLFGVVQLFILFLAGRILYGIDVENHLGGLLIVALLAAAACTAFGMLIASLVSNRDAASGLATFVILVMCAVGGAWFPVSFMPEFIQQLARLTLVYWAVEGFQQVLWADASFRELLPTLGVLGGMSAAVLSIAMWRFNRGRIFD
jgi:ABC-2 type transport system permease protein